MRSERRVRQTVAELDRAQKLGLFLPFPPRLVDFLLLQHLFVLQPLMAVDRWSGKNINIDHWLSNCRALTIDRVVDQPGRVFIDS